MRSDTKTGLAFLGLGCAPILMFFAFNILLGGLATEYVVEYWASYFSGHHVDIPFWVAAVAGLVVAELTVPLAVITWLVSFAMACAVCTA